MATKQEKEIAKQKAIKGGMPSDVADRVFRMQIGKDKSGIDSSHIFPMKQAYNIQMSPLRMASFKNNENSESPNEDSPGDITVQEIITPEGNLATQTDITSSFSVPGETITTMPESQGSYSKVFSGFKTNEKGQRINPINKNVYDNLQQFIDDAKKNPAKPTTTTTPSTTKTKTETTIDANLSDVQGLTPYQQRQDIRRGRILSRNIGKLERKFEKAKDGSKKKDAIKRELDSLVRQSQLRTQQQMQGKTGDQQFKIDKVATPGQKEILGRKNSSTSSGYDTSNLLSMPSTKKSNEFDRFGYKAGSMLESIKMPMMKFRGRSSNYKNKK